MVALGGPLKAGARHPGIRKTDRSNHICPMEDVGVLTGKEV